MDVHRSIQRHPRIQPLHELQRMALGIGGRELAVAIAGAGDESTAQRAGAPVEADFGQGLLHGFDIGLGDVRQDETLPNGQAHLARTIEFRQFGQTPQLARGELPDRHRDPDPMKPRLALQGDPQMRMHRSGWGWHGGARGLASGQDGRQRFPQHRLGLGPEPLQRPLLQQVLEAGPLPVGTVAVRKVDPHHRRTHANHLLRGHQHAEVPGEGLVTRGSAQ